MTLTKADVAQKVADNCGGRLVLREDVMISSFGKWSVKDKHARRGRNPQTGEELVLDARKVVTWSYSPVLKREVNDAVKWGNS